MKKLLLIMAVLLISSCASVSEVIPVGKNTYRVSSEMAGNFPSWSEVKDLALKRANKYCQSKKKYMKEDKWETHGARGWTPLNAELTFQCLADTSDAK